MVKHEIIDNVLHLNVQGADKIFALKSQLSIPLEHVNGIRTDAEVVTQWWHGIKFPGSNIPYVLTAGTFYQDGKRIFWDIHHPKEAVIISLNHETYDELIIEVEDPEAFVKEVEKKMRKHPAMPEKQ